MRTLFGMYPQVDEIKSAAVFVEIVRVRDENSELRERIRKHEAKLDEYQGTKHMIESLKATVFFCASMSSSLPFCLSFLVCVRRLVQTVEVAADMSPSQFGIELTRVTLLSVFAISLPARVVCR
jgi:hypothetical protein